jgi:glycosyltransferase involved in cell wall biosynthesis
MRVLFVSNLFPNPAEPMRGMFNAQQVAALSKYGTTTIFFARGAAAGRRDSRLQTSDFSPQPFPLPPSPFPVLHPPFRHIPILSRPFNGWLFARCIAPHLQPSTLRPQPSTLHPPPSTFDIVLVNWAYPDAYGVMLLAKKYGYPFATTVQGSDVNLLFRNRHRKRQILHALRASRAVFCRSNALRDTLATEGIAATTVYNGVDRDRFHPIPPEEACRQLGLAPNRRRILYVGNLQPVKGPTVLAEAFGRLQTADCRRQTVDLVIVGDGPERDKVTQQTADCGLRTAVSLMGARPHHEVGLWLNACDVLCLPSFNEGLPNVCIEAAACGVPVVASNVGGVPEVVKEGVNGFLVPPGNPEALAAALHRALSHPWDRAAIVQSVAPFDWDANARQVYEVLKTAVGRPQTADTPR